MFIDVSDAAHGNDPARIFIRLAAIGHNGVADLHRQCKILRLDIGRIGDLVSVNLARI